jgi:cytochrome b
MGGTQGRVKVWDVPTRLFHWALAILILLQYGTAEWHWLDMDWHFRFGYATLALLLFRVAWGFVGSASSRFAAFVRGPRQVVRYVRTTFARDDATAGRVDTEALSAESQRLLGHNPLGGWSVLVLLLSLAVQAVSGLFSSDGITVFGPLNGRVSEATAALMTTIHKLNQNVLLVLIALHIGAVLYYLVARRDDLVTPMLHGYKRVVGAAPRMVSVGRALALLVAAALVVWGVVAWGLAAAY